MREKGDKDHWEGVGSTYEAIRKLSKIKSHPKFCSTLTKCQSQSNSFPAYVFRATASSQYCPNHNFSPPLPSTPPPNSYLQPLHTNPQSHSLSLPYFPASNNYGGPSQIMTQFESVQLFPSFQRSPRQRFLPITVFQLLEAVVYEIIFLFEFFWKVRYILFTQSKESKQSL